MSTPQIATTNTVSERSMRWLKHISWRQVGLIMALSLCSIVFLLPLYWMVITAFKT